MQSQLSAIPEPERRAGEGHQQTKEEARAVAGFQVGGPTDDSEASNPSSEGLVPRGDSVERYQSGLCFDLNLDHWFDDDSDRFSTSFETLNRKGQ